MHKIRKYTRHTTIVQQNNISLYVPKIYTNTHKNSKIRTIYITIHKIKTTIINKPQKQPNNQRIRKHLKYSKIQHIIMYKSNKNNTTQYTNYTKMQIQKQKNENKYNKKQNSKKKAHS